MKFPFEGTSVNSLAKQVSSKSAVNPSLWACLVVSLPLFLLASKTAGILSFCFFGIAILPVVAFLISYIYLIFKNPKYLRSEEYQLRAEAMNLIGDKDNPLHADADDIVSVINNPMLPSPNKEKNE
ncbi:MAG: hypothetical protein AAB352_02640 [Patescibacteria group bacterium]